MGIKVNLSNIFQIEAARAAAEIATTEAKRAEDPSATASSTTGMQALVENLSFPAHSSSSAKKTVS